MDFKSLTMNSDQDAQWMDVYHPNGSGEKLTGVRIKVYNAINTQVTVAMIEHKRSLDLSDIDENTEDWVKLNDKSQINIIVKTVCDWEGVEWNGEKLECNEENKRLIFSNAVWLKRQVLMFSEQIENYIGK